MTHENDKPRVFLWRGGRYVEYVRETLYHLPTLVLTKDGWKDKP